MTLHPRPYVRYPAYCVFFAGLTVVSGCVVKGDGTGDPMEAAQGSESGGEPDVVAETGEATTTSASSSETGDESTSDGDESDTGCNFICDDVIDGGECDPWAQDCPEGEKCMPFANDGGPAWNSLRCSPIAEDAKQLGDACTVEGSGVSGLDDCDIGLMCWDVNENGEGICVQQCTGSADAPLCEDPEDLCVIANDGMLNLCLPACDPLIQDCGDGDACYGAGPGFACAPDASGPDLGLDGDPCEFTNACDAGLFCAAAAAVPECEGAQGCCSSFCDLEAANPDSECGGAALGQICEPWYVEGMAPPGFEGVGACVLPQ